MAFIKCAFFVNNCCVFEFYDFYYGGDFTPQTKAENDEEMKMFPFSFTQSINTDRFYLFLSGISLSREYDNYPPTTSQPMFFTGVGGEYITLCDYPISLKQCQWPESSGFVSSDRMCCFRYFLFSGCPWQTSVWLRGLEFLLVSSLTVCFYNGSQ